MSIGFISYSLAALAYLVLSVLLLVSWQRRSVGLPLIAASTLSCAWAMVTALSLALPSIPALATWAAEYGRLVSWNVLLVSLIRMGDQSQSQSRSGCDLRAGFLNHSVTLSALALAAVTLVLPLMGVFVPALQSALQELMVFSWLSSVLLGLVLIEQLVRNATAEQRQRLKTLCLGLGGVLTYDFLLYTDALLFNHPSAQIWDARGVVNACLVPLLAMAAVQNPQWALDVHVSRAVVARSFTIAGAGVYLSFVATAGFLIRDYGATWAEVIGISFMTIAVIALIGIISSSHLRAHMRVFLNKHFFSHKYDYRVEWLRFTDTLSISDKPVPARIIDGVRMLVDSPGGALWSYHANDDFSLLSVHHLKLGSKLDTDLASLTNYLNSTRRVVNLDEYRRDGEAYSPLRLPDVILEQPELWLILPLPFREDLVGFLVLERSPVVKSLNWEDRDLLKNASLQAGGLLAQHQASQALINARQFEAFNRLSAYIVHDLKNILNQQALIVRNAQRHKHNPAFVDDVIGTIDNSVERMTQLMNQLRTGVSPAKLSEVELAPLLQELIERQSRLKPEPTLVSPLCDLRIWADREQLLKVFMHLVQNAQEATDDNGEVQLTLRESGDYAMIEISDNGCGMNDVFVNTRLFQPFDTTKGLTGMGIGAFESREALNALGGSVKVSSRPGHGTVFQIRLPLLTNSVPRVQELPA